MGVLVIQGADIVRIRERHYLNTGEEMSFADAIKEYKRELSEREEGAEI